MRMNKKTMLLNKIQINNSIIKMIYNKSKTFNKIKFKTKIYNKFRKLIIKIIIYIILLKMLRTKHNLVWSKKLKLMNITKKKLLKRSNMKIFENDLLKYFIFFIYNIIKRI